MDELCEKVHRLMFQFKENLPTNFPFHKKIQVFKECTEHSMLSTFNIIITWSTKTRLKLPCIISFVSSNLFITKTLLFSHGRWFQRPIIKTMNKHFCQIVHHLSFITPFVIYLKKFENCLQQINWTVITNKSGCSIIAW